MQTHKVIQNKKRFNAINYIPKLLLGASLAFSGLSVAEEAKPPMGWLFSDINDNEAGVTVSGWLQASYAGSDNGEQLLPATFFRKEDGAALDQFGLMIEKKIKSNVLSRVGAFPGPSPTEFDWGFNITVNYGANNSFFTTYGIDDKSPEDFDNSGNYLTLTQAYLEFYFPVLDGSNLMVGLFHTPLENEIGFPLPSPAPTDFYTHTYSFMHGPAKHFGALWSSKLSSAPGESMLSYELGIVRGWNNFDDQNDDFDIIANLRWRSADFSTWVDFENIYGNGADDSIVDCACGSPIPTSSELAGDDSLMRQLSYLTITKFVDANNRLVAEFSYGKQEKSLFADLFNDDSFDVPEEGGEDASWYGVNVNWHYTINPELVASTRAEFFNTDGVHVLLPYAGDYKAVTANLSWTPRHNIRVRPEIRYDWYSGSATPFGAKSIAPPPLLAGTEDTQLTYSVDVTFFF
jgi:hypothetical protein